MAQSIPNVPSPPPGICHFVLEILQNSPPRDNTKIVNFNDRTINQNFYNAFLIFKDVLNIVNYSGALAREAEHLG